MTVSDRDHAEAVRVLYASCKHAGRPMPATPAEAARLLIRMADRLPSSRETRAEACLLLAASLRVGG